MLDEFKYSVTRVCLRRGQLTLSQRLLEVFPEQGDFIAKDAITGEDLPLSMANARIVTGLTDFFKRHELDVNDKVLIRFEDDTFFFSTTRVTHRTDYNSQEAWDTLIENILTLDTPLSEAEIREMYPDIPKTMDINAVLKQDERLTRREGKWRRASVVPEPASDPRERIDEEIIANPFMTSQDGVTPVDPSEMLPTGFPKRESLTSKLSGKPMLGPRPQSDPPPPSRSEPPSSDASFKAQGGYNTSSESHLYTGTTLGTPPPTEAMAGFNTQAAHPQAPLQGYPHSIMIPNAPFLDSDPSLHERARLALHPFGYHLKPLSDQHLLATAELGRHRYDVLLHLLPQKGRVDWASALQARRETGANYLAVFGHHNDLLKLSSPADIAKATLWSWEGLGRVMGMAENLPLSPRDLEPYFERFGIFDDTVEHFEASLQQRIDEKGVFSAIITRLATMRAPTVFVLDDITADLPYSRGQVAQVLEMLTKAPFQLLSKVSSGEYDLRCDVNAGLFQLSEYALSVRDRLQGRHKIPN